MHNIGSTSKGNGAPKRAVQFHATDAELQRLKRNSPYGGDARSRAEWLRVYYLSGAAFDLHWNDDALYERYGITDRWLDTCFEMGDSDDVVSHLMAMAAADPTLTARIIAEDGQATFDRWKEIARVGGTQLNLLF